MDLGSSGNTQSNGYQEEGRNKKVQHPAPKSGVGFANFFEVKIPCPKEKKLLDEKYCVFSEMCFSRNEFHTKEANDHGNGIAERELRDR